MRVQPLVVPQVVDTQPDAGADQRRGDPPVEPYGQLRDDLGPEAWVDAVNLVPVASFTISKLAWLARNRPDAAGRVDQVVTAEKGSRK